MIKCFAENCDYYKSNGECSSYCTNRGISKIVTNYERIQAMSVEEMSDFLMGWAMDFMMGKSPMNVNRWLESEVADNE